jgi:hypothetical protein
VEVRKVLLDDENNLIQYSCHSGKTRICEIFCSYAFPDRSLSGAETPEQDVVLIMIDSYAFMYLLNEKILLYSTNDTLNNVKSFEDAVEQSVIYYLRQQFNTQEIRFSE